MAKKKFDEASEEAVSAEAETPVEAQDTPVETPAQPEQRSSAKEEADFNKTVSDMKSYLAEQQKVEVYVPLEIGESLKSNPFVPVTINGYRLNVPKGVRVQVPKPVADIIFESLNIYEVNSASAMLADRDEVKDGVSVKDALS
jgi:hypothetical protein